MTTMTREEVLRILTDARAEGREANLSWADLSGANLRWVENASLPAGWQVNEGGLAVKE